MAKTTIDDLAIVFSADTRGFTGAVMRVKRDAAGLAKHLERAGGLKGPPAIVRWAKDAAGAVKSMTRTAVDAAGGLATFAGKVMASGGTLVALEMGLAGAAEVFDQFKKSVQMAGAMEQTHLAFEVMLGDAEDAKKMVGDIRKFAASTPFNSGELTASSKQLVAYGLAADQVIPTIKMLGDVSAGLSIPIEDLTYIYGTLYAQGRAYTRDINQFAMRGIPIWDELAKVTGKSVGELRQLVEEGRIGRSDVTKAFVAMTSEGGRFYRLTERQSDTFLGRWEAMTDALDLAKMKFGQIVIEEFGLKDATKDMDAFFKRVEGGMDGIRPAVRVVGDLIKASAQYANEFGKAAFAAVETAGSGFDQAFPGIAQAARDLRQMLTDAQNFKLDEEQAIRFGASFARAIAVGFATLMQDIGHAMLHFDTLVEGIVRVRHDASNFVRQMAEQLEAIRVSMKDWSKVFAAPVTIVAGYYLQGQGLVGPPGAAPDDPFHPPTPDENDGSQVARFRRIRDEAVAAEAEFQRYRADVREGRRPADANEFNRLFARRDEAARREQRYLRTYPRWPGESEEDRDNRVRHLLAIEGKVPDGGPDGVRAEKTFLKRAADFFLQFSPQGVRDKIDAMEAKGLQGVYERRRLQAEMDAAHALTTAADHLAKWHADMNAARWLQEQQHPGVFLPGGGVGRLVPTAALAQDRETATIGGAGGPLGVASQDPRNVRRVGGVDARDDFARLDADAAAIRREFGDPIKRLEREKADLDKMLALEKINQDEYNRKWVSLVQGAYEQAGGGPYQLPDAATVGSREDAQILTQWMAGQNRPQTVEDLLRQINEAHKRTAENTAKLVEGQNKRPKAKLFGIPVGGW